MMTRRTNTSPPYDAEHDRRDDSRKPDAIKGLWYRRLKPSEILATIVLLGLVLGAAGWRQVSVNDVNNRVTDVSAQLDAKIAKNATRIDSLADRLRFTNYLQCVQLRKTDPASLPSDCAPIIERGAR